MTQQVVIENLNKGVTPVQLGARALESSAPRSRTPLSAKQRAARNRRNKLARQSRKRNRVH